MSDNNLLDLDALMPPSRYVKLQGKTLEVKPLTVRQLIVVSQLNEKIIKATHPDDIMPMIKKALGPVIPQILKDDTIDFTIQQFLTLLEFSQKSQGPNANSMAAKEDRQYSDKKKLDSPSQSQDSSDSTEATPSTT